MLTFVCDRHPQSGRRLYQSLQKYLYSWEAQLTSYRDLGDIVSDILGAGLYPESAAEARDLLSACKTGMGDLSVFRKLWDPLKVPIEAFGNCRYEKLEDSPVYTEDPAQLRWLLECGFTELKYTVLLRAIIRNEKDIVQVFCAHLGLKLGQSNIGILGQDEEPKYVWKLLGRKVFSEIFENSMEEIARIFESQFLDKPDIWESLDSLQWQEYVLVQVACMEPLLTGYVVRGLQIMRNGDELSVASAIELAIELLFDTDPLFTRLVEFLNFGAITDPDPKPVLRRLLNYGVIDPNETSLWQTNIWRWLILDYRLPNGWIIKLFIDAGADINRPLNLYCLEGIKTQADSSTLGHFNIPRTGTPIEVAFVLKTCSVFCLLLQKSATIDELCHKLTSSKRFNIHPEFLQAVKDRDVDSVAKYWSTRIRNPNTEVIAALRKGDVDTARAIILEKNNALRPVSLALGITDMIRLRFCDRDTSGRRQPFHPDPKNCLGEPKPPPVHKNSTEILGLVLETEVDFRPEWRLWNSRYKKEYYRRVKYFIVEDCLPDVLRPLLKFRPTSTTPKEGMEETDGEEVEEMGGLGETDDKDMEDMEEIEEAMMECLATHSYTYAMEQGVYGNLLYHAAAHSVDCLKLLVEEGFGVDACLSKEKISVDDEVIVTSRTALYGAIKRGSIETVAYLLREGADVFRPCGRASSAVEFAISKRRIDPLGMILEAVPDSRAIALAAVDDAKYQDDHYIVEYVRNWKPKKRSDEMGGANVDLTPIRMELGLEVPLDF
ncbi:hypothetical protein TWF281_010935 [Arthrobotrys megalospora]